MAPDVGSLDGEAVMGRVSRTEHRGGGAVETYQELFESKQSAGSVKDQDHPATAQFIWNVNPQRRKTAGLTVGERG